MLSRSELIVLGAVKYGDSSIILKTYSREFGLISFIAGGVSSKKGPLKMIMAQPLTQLEVVFYNSGKSELKRIKEVQLSNAYSSILFDPLKNCIAIFLAEVLKHLLKEEEKNEELFRFLSSSLLILDQMTKGTANFHLVFLYKLAAISGFRPQQLSSAKYFDIMSGTYMEEEPLHTYYLDGALLEGWKKLSVQNFEDLDTYQPGTSLRQKLLDALLVYYRLHINDFGEIRSVEVLHTVLH